MAVCTYNIEITPSDALKQRWMTLLADSARAYNACADFLSENKIPLSVKAVHDAAYGWLREEFPSLPAQAVIKVYKDAMAALKSIRSNGHRDARVPRKKNLAMRLDKRLYGRMTAEGITLSSGDGTRRELVPYILYPKAEEMLLNYPAQDPLLFVRDGRMFLSVPFEVQDRPCLSDTAVGVDLGERQFFVTSEGKSFNDKDYLGRKRGIRHKKRKLQSKGTKSARRKLRKLRRHETNMTKDMCHKAANALIGGTQAGILVLEDLRKIKKKTARNAQGFKKKNHNRRMAQVPFAMFREILSHKAPLFGKRVETVSPTYTSQTDSRTGKRDGERRGRRYVCSDGTVLDADWNAAVNIALRSKHPVSSGVPYDGALTPLTGRALSTAPMHCKPAKALYPRGLASR